MKQPVILNPTTTLEMSMQGIKLVEASAGTGKTFAIGNLYLRMILDGIGLDNILVVTFTNAATEELRGRIRKRIYEALQHWDDVTSDDELLRLWQSNASEDAIKVGQFRLKLALANMDNAAIYTIHAFCQKMLTEHAFDSGQAFDIEMLTSDSMFWEEALKDWWRKQVATQDEQSFAFFEHALPSLKDLIQLQQGLRQPSVKLVPEIETSVAELIKDIQAQLSSLAESWEQESKHVETILLSDVLKRQKNVYKLANIPDLCDTLDHFFKSPDTLNIPQHLPEIGFVKLASALKKGKNESVLNSPFFVLVDEVLPSIQSKLAMLKSKLLAEAHDYARTSVAQQKQQAGQLAFDDQLVHLHDAVSKGSALRLAIRERFPVAMIDEFQDTDAIQYGIFSRLYKQQAACTLMMIGDPKQAIYSFRGGDIFTYMRAKKDADEHYTLDTNWRSTHAMIDAVNALFSSKDTPFFYDAIPFEQVKKPSDDKAHLQLNQEDVPALTIWQVPLNEKGKFISKDVGKTLMHEYVANEIAGLLKQSKEGTLTLGERPVHAGDIAVLTNDHYQAADLREALRQRGVGAVAAGKKHVFESEEADGLRLLLHAILHPKDSGLARAALASGLLAYPLDEIYQRTQDADTWLVWLGYMQSLHDTWEQRDFMPMFQSMLRQLELGERMASLPSGERWLSNLLHLGELLQQAAQSLSGMEVLFTWFAHQCDDGHGSEEAQLRLENDGDLVQISTIHAAKGLEYPIVFVPYIWDCKPRQKASNKLLAYYDEEAAQHCRTLLGEKAQLDAGERERLAEDMRLLYVALTRSSQKLYLTWGEIGTAAKQSALLHLLATPEDFPHDAAIAVEALSLEQPDILVLDVDDSPTETWQAARFTGSLRHDWGISSFTALTRNLVHPTSHTVQSSEADTQTDAIFACPANRYMGMLMHSLMEYLDFQGDLDAQVAQRAPELAAHWGVQIELETIQNWVQHIVHTSLHDSQDLKLASLSQAQRLNELHFDVSMSHLHVHQLNETLQAASPYPLQDLQSFDCRGYLTGEIDMVFEHEGRYFIVDYKSNFLGNSLEDYQAEALQQAIIERRYDVQYLIYTVALHRYLQLRIPNYDYAQHFGGVYYLFLRGMRSEHGCQYGVFEHKPEQALIETLNHDIFGQGVVQ